MKKEEKLISPNEVSSVASNSVTARAIRFLKECFSERSWTSRNLSIGLTSLRHVLGLAVLLSGFTSLACFGQTVQIRIVNVANERPVTKQKITVAGISGKEDSQQEARRKLITKPTTPDLRLVTDDNGDAQFELPKPAPLHFYVRAELSGPLWDCSCLVRVSTEEVIQKGVMFSFEGLRNKPRIQPKPGEILFRLRATSRWVRVLWPLLIR
jgi:hypothetical protein